MWSIGVITYLLVCGGIPFKGKTQQEILTKIIAKDKKIKYPKKVKLTKSCKVCIYFLFRLDGHSQHHFKNKLEFYRVITL